MKNILSFQNWSDLNESKNNSRGKDKSSYKGWVDKLKKKKGEIIPGGVLKSFYYNVVKQGKSCNMSSKKTKKGAFLAAKKSGCNYFSWGDNWYNTETDMPMEQEIKAYAKKSFQYPVVVDYFEMGQELAGGGFGHLQAWSLNEPKYQINAMPEKADIDKVLLGGIGDITSSIGAGKEYEKTMYNQVTSELNKLKKQSIVIKMDKKEYDTFRKIVGNWAGKKVKDVASAVTGASNKSYNLLFANCTDHTVRATLFNLKDISGTLPLIGYKKIKAYYSGRYEERKTGVRVMNTKEVSISVPQEYENAAYVLKNADTIVSNKWTIVLQETLWKQKDAIRQLVGKNPNAQLAISSIDEMNRNGRKKDGTWDRKFSKGGSTDKALQAVRKLVSSGYKPVNVNWKEFFKTK